MNKEDSKEEDLMKQVVLLEKLLKESEQKNKKLKEVNRKKEIDISKLLEENAFLKRERHPP